MPPGCAACGAELPGDAALCGDCAPRLAPAPRAPGPAAPAPLTGWAWGADYAGEVERWVQRFKYPRPGLGGLDPAARGLARHWILSAGGRAGPPPDLVVPVPLHPRRLRARGFNPAAVLGRWLARRCGLRFDPVALARGRDTPSQTGLDRRARRRNVRGAFRARRARVPARVWLVDDVATTGSTLVEAARPLRAAGARWVVGVCAVRTPGP